jgi:hypothetical protein
MFGMYQIFSASDGFRWRLLDAQGQVVARAALAYGVHAECLKAVRCWWKGCPLLIDDQTLCAA